jgi:hypothetical protein
MLVMSISLARPIIAARRVRADMGGLDHCSEIKLGLVRRLAAATVQAEMLEARMMNGEAIDIATLCTLASGQASNGLSGSPGFVRAGKTDPPSLTALALGAPLHAQAGTKERLPAEHQAEPGAEVAALRKGTPNKKRWMRQETTRRSPFDTCSSSSPVDE